MIGRALRQPATIVVGLVLGVLAGFAAVPMYQWVVESYDSTFHVLRVRADIVSLDATQVTLHATGDKLRACQYIRLQAYTVHDRGILHDAQIMRVDETEDRDNKPPGSFNFGVWRIWPREDATSVQVFSQHLCVGRMVVNKILDVQLPKEPP